MASRVYFSLWCIILVGQIGRKNTELHCMKKIHFWRENPGNCPVKPRKIQYSSPMSSTDYRQRSMQGIIGRSPQIELEPFANWAKNIKADVVDRVTPVSVEEIQTIVSAALYYNKTIRVVGGGYTWSHQFPDANQILVDLSNMALEGGQRIVLLPQTEVGDGSTSRIARIAPGVTIGELNAHLKPLGYALRSGPVIREATIIGAIGTSSHGGSYSEPAIGGYMTRVRLVDGSNTIKEFTEDKDIEVMKALRCHLGLLGIIYEIELKVFPEQQINSYRAFIPMKKFFDPNYLRSIIPNNVHVLVLSAPYSSLTEDEAMAVLKTGVVPTTWSSENDMMLVHVADPSSTPECLGNHGPLPPVNVTVVSPGQEFYRLAQVFKLELERISLADVAYLDAAALLPEFFSSEYTFLEDIDFTTTAKAIRELSRYMNQRSYTKGIVPFTRLIARWLKGTSCYLCATSAPRADDSGHFGTLALDGSIGPRYLNDMKELVTSWDRSLGITGTAHWGKVIETFSNFRDRLTTHHGPGLEMFKDIQQTLDPSGLFKNDYLSEVFS